MYIFSIESDQPSHSLLVPIVLNLEHSFVIYSNVLVNAKKKSEIESKFTDIGRMNLKMRVVNRFRSLCFRAGQNIRSTILDVLIPVLVLILVHKKVRTCSAQSLAHTMIFVLVLDILVLEYDFSRTCTHTRRFSTRESRYLPSSAVLCVLRIMIVALG